MTTIEMLPPTTVHNDHIMIVRREGEGSTLIKLSTEELKRVQAVLNGYITKNVRFPSFKAIVTEIDAA